MLFEKSFKYLEMKLAGKLIVPGVSAKDDVLKKNDRMEEAYELGRQLSR
jgi:hypothetical protein